MGQCYKYAMKSNLIIGLTGTHGAGKGAIVDHLKEKGFLHFSAREFLNQEAEKRGLPKDRPSISAIANELRARHGNECVAFSLYEKALASRRPAVIESIYTVGEIEKIREAAKKDGVGFILLAVDADAALRYARISQKRKSETDNITYEEFLRQQEVQMASTDPGKHNLQACRDRADILIINNGTFADLNDAVDRKLRLYFA